MSTKETLNATAVAAALKLTFPEQQKLRLESITGYNETFSSQRRYPFRNGQVKTGIDVLLVWGSQDPLFPLEHAERAHRKLPGSRLAVIEGAGHTPQAERPDEFNRVLESFLRD